MNQAEYCIDGYGKSGINTPLIRSVAEAYILCDTIAWPTAHSVTPQANDIFHQIRFASLNLAGLFIPVILDELKVNCELAEVIGGEAGAGRVLCVPHFKGGDKPGPDGL